MCELSCHGGALVTEKVLKTVLSAGARLAEPGEFTKRAFINGKMLLDEAEAVGEIIEADSERCLEAAAGNLESGVGKRLSGAKATINEIIARFFAVIDWPDEEIEEEERPALLEKLGKCEKLFSEALSGAAAGRIIKEGLSVVIAGAANAGKSTLMNALADSERSIVTNVPGTTRDVVSETVSLRGLKIRLSDTAGLRESGDEIEIIGVSIAVSALKKADLILFAADSNDLGRETAEAAKTVAAAGKPFIAVFTKTDLSGFEDKDIPSALAALGLPKDLPSVALSAATGENMAALADKTVAFAGVSEEKGPVVMSERQYGCLKEADEAVKRAIELIKQCEMPDKTVAELTAAAGALSRLDGTKADEEILKTIFDKFCVGK